MVCCVILTIQPSDFLCLTGGSSVALRLRAWVPPRYFLPVSTLDSCFAQTSKCSHASFAVPSLKYFLDIFNQTAAIKMRVGPFLGSCFKQVALGTGSTIFQIFSLFSSSIVFTFFSLTGFKNPSGMLTWMSRWTAPLITDSRVALSVTLVRALMFAHTSERCSCACAAWLKISVINAISSAHLTRSGSCLMKSSPDGISLGRSTTLMPLAIKCCHKYSAIGSFIVLRMTSTSASPMLCHYFATIFLKF